MANNKRKIEDKTNWFYAVDDIDVLKNFVTNLQQSLVADYVKKDFIESSEFKDSLGLFSGSYTDLTDVPNTFAPEIGTTATTALAGNTKPADIGAATAAQGALADSAVQPSSLSSVATSGNYTDLNGKPVAAAVTDSIATDVAGLVADFNSLLASLRTAGLLEQ